MTQVSGTQPESPLPTVTPSQQKRLLEELLRGVSRSFYLTLRVLPADLRRPIGLAYLLARAADTISDTRLLSPDQRREHLLAFRAQVIGPARLQPLRHIASVLTDKQSISPSRSMSNERELLTSLPQAFALLEATPEPDLSLVRGVVVTLTQGMEDDLTGFPAEDSGTVVALPDAAALDRYTYLVAGCVGWFWTAVTMAHSPSLRRWDKDRMSDLGIRFGKALQLTNVLRDVPSGLRMGRCYLPEDELSGLGISPMDLLNRVNGAQARPLLVDWINIALSHFDAAEEYLLAIPRRSTRLRLAVLWPVLIGLATMGRLANNESWLDPACPSRVSRSWVYKTLIVSCLVVVSNRVLRFWIGRLRRRVVRTL